MSSEQRYPDVGSEPARAERPSDSASAAAEAEAEERLDLQEDRRRQQDLDYTELGGES